MRKVEEAREAIRNAGARMLLLPPYGPDPNPIRAGPARLDGGASPACAKTQSAGLRQAEAPDAGDPLAMQ